MVRAVARQDGISDLREAISNSSWRRTVSIAAVFPEGRQENSPGQAERRPGIASDRPSRPVGGAAKTLIMFFRDLPENRLAAAPAKVRVEIEAGNLQEIEYGEEA